MSPHTRDGGDPTVPAMARHDRVLSRLSGSAVQWISGGPIHSWTPVHGRFGKPVTSPGHLPHIVITRTEAEPSYEANRLWLEHQRKLVRPRAVGTDGSMLFWRLAIKQRAFAIGAHPRPDLGTTIQRVDRLISRAGRLEVMLGYFPGELIASWVVLDKDEPVFVGLPEHHVMPTTDPTRSLAAILASARIRHQVHIILPPPHA